MDYIKEMIKNGNECLSVALKQSRNAYSVADIIELIDEASYSDDEVKVSIYINNELCWFTVTCNGHEDGYKVEFEDQIIFEDEYDSRVIAEELNKIIQQKCTHYINYEPHTEE
jgi:hypothetical protein